AQSLRGFPRCFPLCHQEYATPGESWPSEGERLPGLRVRGLPLCRASPFPPASDRESRCDSHAAPFSGACRHRFAPHHPGGQPERAHPGLVYSIRFSFNRHFFSDNQPMTCHLLDLRQHSVHVFFFVNKREHERKLSSRIDERGGLDAAVAGESCHRMQHGGACNFRFAQILEELQVQRPVVPLVRLIEVDRHLHRAGSITHWKTIPYPLSDFTRSPSSFKWYEPAPFRPAPRPGKAGYWQSYSQQIAPSYPAQSKPLSQMHSLKMWCTNRRSRLRPTSARAGPPGRVR